MQSVLTLVADAFFFAGQVLSLALLVYGASLCALARIRESRARSTAPAARDGARDLPCRRAERSYKLPPHELSHGDFSTIDRQGS
jgi:hypothetical protein